jgi:hypothetical protein
LIFGAIDQETAQTGERISSRFCEREAALLKRTASFRQQGCTKLVREASITPTNKRDRLKAVFL